MGPGAERQPEASFSFGKELRLRKRREFLTVQRRGRRRHAPHFVVVSLRRGKEELTRAGFTVSREVGNAVERNRVKRHLREFFRHHRRRLPESLDLVFIARRGAHELSHADIERELLSATGLE